MARNKYYRCPETGYRIKTKGGPSRRSLHPNSPGKVEKIKARRREEKQPPLLHTPGRVDNETKAEVLAVGACEFCGSTDTLTVDHIVPQSKGGGHHRANLQCLCRSCNHLKNDRIMTPEQYRALSSRERRNIEKSNALHCAIRYQNKERKYLG